MTPMPVSSFDLSNSDEELYVEVDPTGRYGRYKDLLGFGSFKKVYRAFDQERGIEVAWNQEKLRNFADDPERIEQLFSEVRLLKGLRCENIIRLYNVWTNVEERTLNFITEACTSGNLREYRLKHRHVSLIAIKKWCRQILKGLDYLHTRQPCIIHRDLNCSNIFVNGNTGQIKIGDLGLAILNGENRSRYSVQGTAEYMAPELYEEDYTELVDIYSFGLCVLEMVTLTIPYEECDHVVKIYKKVSEGVKPLAFDKVKDPQVKDFIEKCIGKPRDRPSASELLRDPFFHGLD